MQTLTHEVHKSPRKVRTNVQWDIHRTLCSVVEEPLIWISVCSAARPTGFTHLLYSVKRQVLPQGWLLASVLKTQVWVIFLYHQGCPWEKGQGQVVIGKWDQGRHFPVSAQWHWGNTYLGSQPCLLTLSPVPHGLWSLECQGLWKYLRWSMQYVLLGAALGSRVLAAAVWSLPGVSAWPVRKAPWHSWNLLSQLSCTLRGLMQ